VSGAARQKFYLLYWYMPALCSILFGKQQKFQQIFDESQKLSLRIFNSTLTFFSTFQTDEVKAAEV